MKAWQVWSIVLMTHALYLLVSPDPAIQGRWFYVLRGVEGFLLFAFLFDYCRAGLAALGAAFGAFEELQTAACGIRDYAVPVKGGMLCVSQYGTRPYWVFGALGFIYLVWTYHVRKNRSRS